MKTTGLGFLVAAWCVAASGCQSTPGVSTFLSDGEPDLIPLPQAGFCRDATVVITLRNQGPSDADASTTTVTFAGGGSTELPTPSVEGGRIATLAAVPIPAQCFAPDCFLQVIVDANDDIDESDENNNTAELTCSPS
jgi:subtilase family serine protease